MRILQNASRELQEAEAVINDLKKQLEAKEEFLKSNNKKQEQLQSAISSLTKTLESLNQKAQVLCVRNPRNSRRLSMA
jgi:chromosome segregation ATPase